MSLVDRRTPPPPRKRQQTYHQPHIASCLKTEALTRSAFPGNHSGSDPISWPLGQCGCFHFSSSLPEQFDQPVFSFGHPELLVMECPSKKKIEKINWVWTKRLLGLRLRITRSRDTLNASLKISCQALWSPHAPPGRYGTRGLRSGPFHRDFQTCLSEFLIIRRIFHIISSIIALSVFCDKMTVLKRDDAVPIFKPPPPPNDSVPTLSALARGLTSMDMQA